MIFWFHGGRAAGSDLLLQGTITLGDDNYREKREKKELDMTFYLLLHFS